MALFTLHAYGQYTVTCTEHTSTRDAHIFVNVYCSK